MRGCNEARPDRNWGEQRFRLQRASAESAKTRGASESEPAALKVQLGEVEGFIDSPHSLNSVAASWVRNCGAFASNEDHRIVFQSPVAICAKEKKLDLDCVA